MKSIQGLFDETKNDISPKYADRLARRYRYFDKDIVENNIPLLNFPPAKSDSFKNDIEEVRRCYSQPSLNTSFLKNSDDSVEDTFKNYCKESGYHNLNWKLIKDILDDVDSIVLKLKMKFNRPRPINFFDDRHELKIKYKESPSYPSGHTTIAYFLCDLIAHFVPEARQDLQTLASLVGQSRIENAVHYPSDIDYGRLIGETLSDIYLRENNVDISKSIKKKHHHKFSDYMLENCVNWYDENPEESLVRDFAEFLHRTNGIERYKVPYAECVEASRQCMQGYPTSHITDNPHLASQINGIISAFNCNKIDNIYKIQNIHRKFNNVLERGDPGEIRNFPHNSPNGVNYPEPYSITGCLKNMFKFNLDPWSRHVVYEWIHPFCDGNGRSGRIIMLSDCGFNFSRVNEMIGNGYIDNLVKDMNVDLLKKLFKM